MKTISYSEDEWKWTVWPQLAKDHSALSMGKDLGFTLRKETQVVSCDDAPAGYDRIIAVHLDFTDERDYIMFVLKYQ